MSTLRIDPHRLPNLCNLQVLLEPLAFHAPASLHLLTPVGLAAQPHPGKSQKLTVQTLYGTPSRV
jgi:hypothetical protein